eukprot:9070640-Alexandrium_andersonii.AAC.1
MAVRCACVTRPVPPTALRQDGMTFRTRRPATSASGSTCPAAPMPRMPASRTAFPSTASSKAVTRRSSAGRTPARNADGTSSATPSSSA